MYTPGPPVTAKINVGCRWDARASVPAPPSQHRIANRLLLAWNREFVLKCGVMGGGSLGGSSAGGGSARGGSVGAVVGGGTTGGNAGVGVVRSGSAGGVTLSPSLTAHDGTRD